MLRIPYTDVSSRNIEKKDSTCMRAYTFSSARTALYLLTHISLRDSQFSFYLRLYLWTIPPVLFYLEISNDPPDTFVLSYSSPATFVSVSRSDCSESPVLHVLKSGHAFTHSYVTMLHLLMLRFTNY